MQVLNKLTLKHAAGKIDLDRLNKIRDAGAAGLPLADIVGIASDFKPDSSSLGEFVRFFGNFQSTNLTTGEVSRSGQVILPKAAQDVLYGALMSLGSDEKRAVQFAFRVLAVYDESAAVKYVFAVHSLLNPGESDPLAGLHAALVQSGYTVPALAAPTAPAAPTVPEAPAATVPPAPAAAPPAPAAAPPEAPKAVAAARRR